MTNQRSKTLYKFNEATKTAEWTVMKYDEVQMVVQMSPSGISFASANGAMGYSSCDHLQDLQDIMSIAHIGLGHIPNREGLI
jgi:hypothetical protein